MWLSSCTNLWKSILGEHFEVTEVNLKTLLGVITQPSQQEIFPLTIYVTSVGWLEGAELIKCRFLPIISYYNIILLIRIWFIDFWKQQNSVNWTPNSGHHYNQITTRHVSSLKVNICGHTIDRSNHTKSGPTENIWTGEICPHLR